MYVQPLCRSVPIEAGQLLRLYSRFLPAERARPSMPLAGDEKIRDSDLPRRPPVPAARRLPARACPPDEKIRDLPIRRAPAGLM